MLAFAILAMSLTAHAFRNPEDDGSQQSTFNENDQYGDEMFEERPDSRMSNDDEYSQEPVEEIGESYEQDQSQNQTQYQDQPVEDNYGENNDDGYQAE
jgi:hypothetical protein